MGCVGATRRGAAPADRLAGAPALRARAALACLEGRERAEPVVFLLASLREPERDVASFLSRRCLAASAQVDPRATPRSLSSQEPALVQRRRSSSRRGPAPSWLHARLARLPGRATRAGHRSCNGLCGAASAVVVGEPPVDGLHEPRALAFECNGRAMLAPLEGDVMRWSERLVEHRGRSLSVESEQGRSWQAQLVARCAARAAGLSRARVPS